MERFVSVRSTQVVLEGKRFRTLDDTTSVLVGSRPATFPKIQPAYLAAMGLRSIRSLWCAYEMPGVSARAAIIQELELGSSIAR